ncbi:MAG: hypothetical protein IJ397_06445 [Lachnospiraceae bacterium]|nr:hypothetical protein [Lachnospiraceae bacterium]
MKKKTKIFLGIVAVVLVTAVFYFTVLHPRVKVGFQVLRIYNEYGFEDIGDPCQPFTAYDVTDDSLVTKDCAPYYIGVPEDMLEIDEYEDLPDIKYVGRGDRGEQRMVFSINIGYDEPERVILNEEVEEDAVLYSRLCKAYDKLGYGIPNNLYATMKCSLLLAESDYNFLNYYKSLAFAYALEARYWLGGPDVKTYYYETDDKCALIYERVNTYQYLVVLFDTDDLNTYYYVVIETPDPAEAYAIINSIEFK